MCAAEGLIRYTCERCQKTKDEKTEPLGHTQGKAVYENVNLATCQAEGSRDKVIYCTVCKAELSRTTEILPKTDHDRTLVGEKKATCMGGGYTGDVVCSMCGEILKPVQQQTQSITATQQRKQLHDI